LSFHVRNNWRCYRLLVACALLSTLGKTCAAASADFSAARLSEIWREEFPVPARPARKIDSVQNVGMAPPTSSTTKTVPFSAGVPGRLKRPHPAVARVIVPETGATSFGSGTLIDVRGKFGMVITNWHVVRDATGTIEVVFPSGFSSKARALKVDSDWDLAALVVWRPSAQPVSISERAPQPGDKLTICGYGQGSYRCATGHCTQYYAPRLDFPRHMVELDVEARQGDSGGPIFNEQGEMAGVLFGAGQGTTLGSFGGRVGAFLATLAPDIGRATESLAANQTPPGTQGQPQVASLSQRAATLQPQQEEPHQEETEERAFPSQAATQLASVWPTAGESDQTALSRPVDSVRPAAAAAWQAVRRGDNLFEQVKTALAAIGLLAIVIQFLRVAR